MRVAIITGAAQGIGRRTAEIFAAAGYSLALMDIRSCDSTLAAVRAQGADAEEFIGDISDEATVTLLRGSSAKSLGTRRRPGEQRWNQLYLSSGDCRSASISTCARGESRCAIPPCPGLRSHDA